MNRVILILNVIVLGVTFVVAISASSTQAGILDSTARAAYGSTQGRTQTFLDRGAALSYLRVLQSLESTLPAEKASQLTSVHHRAILDAVVAYNEAVSGGVLASLSRDLGAEDARKAIDALGLDSREAVERALGTAFLDADTVNRLATAVIVNCR